MRLLYLAPDPVPQPKGASVRIEATLRALQGLGHEVRLLTPASPLGRLDFLEHDTVPLPQQNFLDRMLAWRQAAARWLEGRVADAVQFRSIWEGIAAARWARGRPSRLVFECHGFPSLELPYHFPGLEARPSALEKIMAEERAVLGASRLVLTHSQTGRRGLLLRGVRPERIAVVPNAVDPELFSPGPEPAAGPPWRLVYTGTCAPWQGLHLLLEALALLRKGPPLELHVVGPRKGPWQAQLRWAARRLRVDDSVHVCGAMSQADLAPVLRSAHVCVAPMPADPRNSVQGCCPIKVLEYLAAGRPILATAIAPLLEILEHGRDAYLARPNSPAALAEGLRWLLADRPRAEALGRRGRATILAAWTPRHFRENLARALDTAPRTSEALI